MPRAVPRFRGEISGEQEETVDKEKYARIRQMIEVAKKRIFAAAPELQDEANWKPLIARPDDAIAIRNEKWKDLLRFLKPIENLLDLNLPYRDEGDLEEIVSQKIVELEG